MGDTREIRSCKGSVELRDGPNGPMIAGYGAVFNRDSSDLGFIEQVDPGAFSKTIQEADVRGLANHDSNWLLGRSKSGTLRLRTDNIGLYYEIDVNESDPDGQRALAKVRRGDWDGSSFCFQAVRDQWDWSAEPPQRRLLEVALMDVGPVTYPAYPDATAAARALEPLADKMGRSADELVVALKTGELRSLMGGVVAADEERAVWSTAYMNDLPDSAFLYIESGGEKDSDGKTTPRSLRHFPYKDANGKTDLPHLRNALARIPQSDLPDSVKESVEAMAKKLLAANTDAKNSLEEDNMEERAGKQISAANMQRLQEMHDSLTSLAGGLRDLMDTALGNDPADSDVSDSVLDPDDSRMSVAAAHLELRDRLAKVA